VAQTPTDVTIAPGEAAYFQPVNVPIFMTPVPSSFVPVAVCVVNNGEQPVAVESDTTALILVAPEGYLPLVSATLADSSQLPAAFRGCQAVVGEPSGMLCAAGGRTAGGGILAIAVSELLGDGTPISVAVAPQSAVALPSPSNSPEMGTTVAIENDSPSEPATVLWDGTNLMLGFGNGAAVQVERLVVGEQELTADEANCSPADASQSSVVCPLAAWPSVVVAVTSVKTSSQ
jgi:hypothetical protein